MPVKYQAKLPSQVPDAAGVYGLPAVQVSAASLQRTAKSLGLGAAGVTSEIINATDMMGLNIGRHSLTVHRVSGALAFHHRDKYGREPQKAFDLSDRRADAIGRAFLTKTKVVPIASAKLARVTHLNSASADKKTRKVQQQVTDAGVVYRRMLEEQIVEGPGGFCLVAIDPEAEVVALRSVWRPAGPRVGRVKLKQPEEAMKAFETSVRNVRGDIVVTKASFGYFELGPLDRQKVIEPAYAFVYVVQDKDVAFKSAFVMHAGDQKFGQLQGRKRFPAAAQTTRKK
jgi:hypothetical protein